MRESRLSLLVSKELARRLKSYINACTDYQPQEGGLDPQLPLHFSKKLTRHSTKSIDHLNSSFRKDPIDFTLLRQLKSKEAEIISRCFLIHFKVKDELK